MEGYIPASGRGDGNLKVLNERRMAAITGRGGKHGAKRRRTRITKVVSERPIELTKLELKGLDRDFHSMIEEDQLLVKIHAASIPFMLAPRFQLEDQLYELTPHGQLLNINLNHYSRLSMATTFNNQASDLRLAEQLLGISELPFYNQLMPLKTSCYFVPYALDWLASFGVTISPDTRLLAIKEACDVAELNPLFVQHFHAIHDQLVESITMHHTAGVLPKAIAEEVVEYILPNRPQVTRPVVKIMRMVRMIAFPVRHYLLQCQTALHARCMEHYLSYRRTAALSLDALLAEHHKSRGSAKLYTRSRAVKRHRMVKEMTTPAVPQRCGSMYRYMTYAMYDFRRVGRHAWTAMVVGTETSETTGEALSASDTPRAIRLRQTDVARRPWILSCHLPQMVLNFREHWTVPLPPLIDYWYYISSNNIGFCTRNYNWHGVDVTSVLDMHERQAARSVKTGLTASSAASALSAASASSSAASSSAATDS